MPVSKEVVAAGGTALAIKVAGVTLLALVFFFLVYLTYLIVKYSIQWVPNLVRSFLANRFLFRARLGEMQALVVEYLGKFHRMWISCSQQRWEEFRHYCNSRNFKYLHENNLWEKYFAKDEKGKQFVKAFPEYKPPEPPKPLSGDEASDESKKKAFAEAEARFDLWNEMIGMLEDEQRRDPKKIRVPYILVRDDREKRDEPIYIGLPWLVSVKKIREVKGQKRPTAYVDLSERSAYVPTKQDAPKEATGRLFYMDAVPDARGVLSQMTLAVVFRIHDPYAWLYNVDFPLHTLLNQIVPGVRQAVAEQSWEATVAGETEKDRKGVQKSIQIAITDGIRTNLKIWNPETKERLNIEAVDGKTIERYPEEPVTVLSRAYHHYGIYTVDVLAENLRAPSIEGEIVKITTARFGARAVAETAKGAKQKSILEGEGAAYAERVRIEAMSAYQKVGEETGIPAGEVMRQDSIRKVAANVDTMVAIGPGGASALEEMVVRGITVAGSLPKKGPSASVGTKVPKDTKQETPPAEKPPTGSPSAGKPGDQTETKGDEQR